MKVIRRSPDKYWIFLGDRTLVVRLKKKVRLIPRWRIASALAFAALATGISIAYQNTWAGAFMGAVAIVLMWAASN